jgi:quinol monooxygenase YgiN
MRFSYRLVAASLLALGVGCSSSSSEEPPASEATEGAEAPQPELPPAPEETTTAPPAPPSTPETGPAAAVTTPPAPQMPPYAAVVIHEVKDYDAWKPVFDSDVEARKQAGIVGEGVMRGVDNDKLLMIYMPATDAEKVKAMTESKELKAKMKEGGVKGKPTVLIFKDEGGKMAPPDKTGLYGALLQYNVKDFAAFKTALESQEPARNTAGILGYGLGQSVDKETQAFVYLQSDDAAKIKTYLDAKETKAAMKEAGVKGQPKVTIVQEGSMTMYQQ